MIHRRGNKADPLPALVVCPVCSCPNKPGVAKCMYCRADLPVKRGYSSIHRQIRSFFKPSRGFWESVPILRTAVSGVMSVCFAALGVFFVSKALKAGGYFNWTIAALLLLYSGAAIWNCCLALFNRKTV